MIYERMHMKDLTVVREINILSRQDKTRQDKTRQDKLNCVFLCPFGCHSKTEYSNYVRNRRNRGAVCSAQSGGFCALVMRSALDGLASRRCKLACNRLLDRSDKDAANAASSSELTHEMKR